ncbi:hypothetical protein [Paraburkholderia fungorum]|nr:hypothetical protein [Paraburkholderia fungorum]
MKAPDGGNIQIGDSGWLGGRLGLLAGGESRQGGCGPYGLR